MNGTSLGTYYGADYNAATIFGSTGTFEYYNNTLTGLGDDDANQAILGPDVLSDIKNLIPNNTTSFPITLTHCPGASLEDNMVWLFFLTFSSDTCGSVGLNLGSDTTLCPGSLLTLDATTPNAVYNWQDGSSNPTFTVSLPGVYSVNLNVNGCQYNDTITISGLLLPEVELGNDTSFCQGQSLTLDVTIPNGVYLWQDNTSNPIYTISQSGTYLVNVSNTCGVVNDSIVVTVIELPVVNLGNDTIICSGQSVLLDAAVSNGSYLWQDNSTDSTLLVTQSGTYSVVVTSGGCSATDFILVTVNPLPAVNLGNDSTLCQGQPVVLNATVANGTYLWSTNSIAPFITVIQSGTYSVQVTVDGCVGTDTISINFNTIPVVTLGPDVTLCDGETLLLDASVPGGSYLWNNNSTNGTLLVAQAGNYSIQVTVNGCTGADTIIVTYNAIPSVQLGNDTSLCQGQTIILDATTLNAGYLWQDNSAASSITISQPGLYWVVVTVNNCAAGDSINVAYVPLPVVGLGNDSIVCIGDLLVLDATTPGGNYLWNNNSTAPLITVGQPGTYWVDVMVAGCSGSDSVQVSFEDCEVILEIPNVITPNNDGLNDLFTPIISKGIVQMHTTLFNRWGNEIYSTDKLEIEWNGKTDGTFVVDGVYFWVIDFTDKRGKHDFKKGTLTIIK